MDSAVSNMSRSGHLYHVRGIFQTVSQRKVSNTEIELLKKLSTETFEYGGRKVGSYALAALHILGAHKYNENDTEVLELIQTMPEFKID